MEGSMTILDHLVGLNLLFFLRIIFFRKLKDPWGDNWSTKADSIRRVPGSSNFSISDQTPRLGIR